MLIDTFVCLWGMMWCFSSCMIMIRVISMSITLQFSFLYGRCIWKPFFQVFGNIQCSTTNYVYGSVVRGFFSYHSITLLIDWPLAITHVHFFSQSLVITTLDFFKNNIFRFLSWMRLCNYYLPYFTMLFTHIFAGGRIYS